MNITGITLAEAWRNGGPLMWVLAGLSVIALAVVLYLLVAQRRGALTPHALISDVFSRLQAGDHGEARRLCQRRPCAFGVLVLAALDAVRGTPQGMRPPVAVAVETAGAHLADRIQASVDWLADIAAIAPLVGGIRRHRQRPGGERASRGARAGCVAGDHHHDVRSRRVDSVPRVPRHASPPRGEAHFRVGNARRRT